MALDFQNKPALVAYVTCGDPDLPTTREVILAAIDAGADIIELGVPFSDPVADGPVIQRASERGVRNGTTLEKVLAMGAEIRRRSQVGMIIFSYYNPILRFGVKRFAAQLEEAGIDGALATDLPTNEAQEYLREMRERRLATVFLAAPTSTDGRLKEVAKASTGFLYAVSRTGVTGARQELADDASRLVKRIRKFTKLPVAVGFGISTSEQFMEVGAFAEAAVVGSAIVDTIERNPGREPEAVAEFITKLVSLRRPVSVAVAKG